MKRVIAVLAMFVMLTVAPVNAADTRLQFISRVYNSVILLYSQDEEGGMKMLCSGTAYRKLADGKGFRFVSASHCVSGETDEEQKSGRYFVTLDATGAKTFIPAKLIEAGDRNQGDDFSIFEAKIDNFDEMTPLGDSDKVSIGEDVVNVASPMGLGKQYFQGYISNTLIDRPPLDAGDTKWTNVMLVAIGGGPGSSGSAIVSDQQHAIIGFLVGEFGRGHLGFVVVPVNKFKHFEELVDSGKYKKTHKSHEDHLF